MTTINEIFQTFGPQYLKRYGRDVPNMHRKAIQAIIGCRTEAYGLVLFQCEKCGQSHLIYRSCGNRHCPTCQYHKTQQWLDRHLKRQLPGHHFMITFTVPENLRRFIRKNQRAAYSALFKASSEAIKKLALDQKYIGGDLPGFLGVLHTWGRTPYPLHRPRRRLINQGRPLAPFKNRLLSARQSPLQNLQGQVPR